jgi:hypothetical protein
MKAASLSVDKVEFVHIKVVANSDYDGEYSAEFKQVDFSFQGVNFRRRMSLHYDRAKSDDPKSFVFGLNVLLSDNPDVADNAPLPYDIDIKAVVYMRYESDELEGMERFRAVRATGYSILYGAIREMVSNLTARCPHGMWSLPSANFNSAAHDEAGRDEVKRQEYLLNNALPAKKKPVKRTKKVS